MSRPIRITFQVHNGAERAVTCHSILEECVLLAALEAEAPDPCKTCDIWDHGQCDDCSLPEVKGEVWAELQSRIKVAINELGVHFLPISQVTEPRFAVRGPIGNGWIDG